MDQATVLFRIPEGTIFGEPEIVRLLAGHNDSGNAHTESSATLDKVGCLGRIYFTCLHCSRQQQPQWQNQERNATA